MTDPEHDQVYELLALYALGGLEAGERLRVEAHLAGCPTCQAEADGLTALMATVASSVPARAPDASLRARVLTRAAAHSPRPARPTVLAPAPARRRSVGRWLNSAAALLAIGLIAWNVYLSSQISTLRQQMLRGQAAIALMSAPDTTEIGLAGQANFSDARGKAYVDPKSGSVVLVVQRLEPLGAGQTYQAWIITADGPRSAGLFGVTAGGWGMTWLDEPYSAGGAIGVSVEPAGGSELPTQVVLLGNG